MALWVGFQLPICLLIYTVYVGYTAQDVVMDYGAGKWKTTMAYHTDEHKVKLYKFGAYSVTPTDAAAAITVVVITSVALLRIGSWDDLGLLAIIVGVCVFRQYRIVPVIDHLSKDESYVGWEKYARGYIEELRFYDAVLVAILFASILSQLESMRVTKIKATVTLSRGPWAALILALLAGTICKNTMVDLVYPTWRKKTVYYTGISTLSVPFHLYDEGLYGVAVLLCLFRVLVTKNMMHIASLVFSIVAAVIVLGPLTHTGHDLSILKQSTSKALREERATTLLGEAHTWNLAALSLLLLAITTQVMADRFVREVTPEEKEKAQAEKAAAAKVTSPVHILCDDDWT